MKTIIISIVSAFLITACTQSNAQENLTVGELHTIQFNEDDNKVLLDVRTAQEYAEGNIMGSENLDVLRTDLFTTSIQKLDKNKTYFVICRSGSRSQRAVQKMKDAGFKNVTNVTGGMQAWQKAGLPIEK